MTRDSTSKTLHISVMLDEALAPFSEKENVIFVDATLGGGGHLAELFRIRPHARVIAIDQDLTAIERANTRFRSEISTGQLTLKHANFAELGKILQDENISAVDGILADLGVSSDQLDVAERGFSFRHSGALDMRMDRRQKISAAEIVNSWSEQELAEIFYRYGEERESRRIARKIVERRAEQIFSETADLAEVISSAFSESQRRKMGIHPATRTFQALRIAVNHELSVLENFLHLFPDVLRIGGVASIITFHSLEDRLVKERFRALSRDCICPPSVLLPCARCGKPPMELLQRKPLIASETEIEKNPRARSAKLRQMKRIR